MHTDKTIKILTRGSDLSNLSLAIIQHVYKYKLFQDLCRFFLETFSKVHLFCILNEGRTSGSYAAVVLE